MVSYIWPAKHRKLQKMMQVWGFFFVLGNQYLLKVTSLALSTVIAVEMSALLVKRQGKCNFKMNAGVLKLGLDGKRGYEKEEMKNSCLVVQLNYFIFFFNCQLVRIPVGCFELHLLGLISHNNGIPHYLGDTSSILGSYRLRSLKIR